MGFTRVCNNAADAKYGGRRFNVNNHHHENRRHYNNKRAQAREYVEEYPQYTPCVQEYPVQEPCFYSPASEYPAHQECNYYPGTRCCPECRDVQVKRTEQDWRKGNRSSGPARRDVTRIQRQPGQSLPGTIAPPAHFHHTPYAVSEQVDSNTTDAAVEEYSKFKAPSADPLCYDMPPCKALSMESPLVYHAHEETVYNQPKDRILCLRWVNGSCGEKRKNASAEEQATPLVCPYAHPDLSEVPPGVCPTYWFTGFCRFDRRDQSQVEPEDESHEFGLHGWTHYKRLENNISDDSSNDGEKKKSNNSRRRPPSVCYSCHHAQPVGGFPLLPGISCKTTVLEREAALALYPKWY